MARITDIHKDISIGDIKEAQGYKETDIRFDIIYGNMLSALRDNIMCIEFVKKSGEIRKMFCTRNNEYILANYANTNQDMDGCVYSKDNTQAVQTQNDIRNRLVKVLDIEKKDFRSIMVDNIQKIDYIKKL